MFEAITENFPRLMTGIKPQIQGTQRIPSMIKAKEQNKNPYKHIIFK